MEGKRFAGWVVGLLGCFFRRSINIYIYYGWIDISE